MDIDELFPDNPEIAEIIKREQAKPERVFDDEPTPGLPQKSKQVPDGTYTVVVPGDSKPHRTIEVTPWKSRPGFKVFSLLTGPDNSLDFLGFGQQGPDGTFRVWGAHRGKDEWITAAQALITIYTDGDLGMASEMYALKSKRCARCHYKLTVPASLHRGYGPDCAEAMGLI